MTAADGDRRVALGLPVRRPAAESGVGPLQAVAPYPLRVVLNWGRRYSLWVFNFGLACCAIEFIAASMGRHDFIRLGVIPFAHGPRQADLMVVSGTVTDKMAPAVRRLYDQMPEPKYVISFGACSNSGGPYWDSYCVTKGVDQIIPVDVYVPGLPAPTGGAAAGHRPVAGEDRRGGPRPALPPSGGCRRRHPCPGRAPRRGRTVSTLRPSAVQDTFATGLGLEIEVTQDGAGAPVVDVPVGRWLEAAHLAHTVMGLHFLDWLSAVDQSDADPPGFDVVLHVADPSAITRRLLLRTRTEAADPRLASLTGLWPGVAWHERETFEMFGVVFEGFADGQLTPDGAPLGLRPLLLPDGFSGTPLRKSFVLAARASKPWPGAKEPGESEGAAAPSRRKTRPPGVPDPQWGPREPDRAR